MLRHSSTIAVVATLIFLSATEVAHAQRGRGGGGGGRRRRRRRYGTARRRHEPTGRDGTSVDADEPAGDGRNESADGRRKHDPTGHGQLQSPGRWQSPRNGWDRRR